MEPTSANKSNRIIQAARILLRDHGSAKTTIKKVASEADVSRGLLHYYFENKEELIAKVIRVSEEELFTVVEDIFLTSETADELAVNLTNGFREQILQNPGFQSITFEGWVMGRQGPMIAQELQNNYRKNRTNYKRLLEEAFSRGVIAPRIPIEEVTYLVLALLHGFGIMLTITPNLVEDESVWDGLVDGIRLVFQGDVSEG